MAFGRDANANTGQRARRGGAAERLPFRPTELFTADCEAEHYDLVLCNPTAGGFAVLLPLATGHERGCVTIKNASASTNTITVTARAGETIDGSATYAISVAREAVSLYSDGANWHKV